jgi:hypothetical protein
MALSDITREVVIAACHEFDEIGQEHFLERYGFGRSKTYRLLYDGKLYDSKAILGAAHGLLGPGYSALRADDFSGGLEATVRVLQDLGFEVVTEPSEGRNEPPRDCRRPFELSYAAMGLLSSMV